MSEAYGKVMLVFGMFEVKQIEREGERDVKGEGREKR